MVTEGRCNKRKCSYIIVYKGNIIHSVKFGELQLMTPGLIGVNEEGKITFTQDLSNEDPSLEVSEICYHSYDQLIDYKSRLIIPGFVDGHAHAPQYSFLGIGMHLPLLEWLNKYTFPKESEFEDLDYADSIYTSSVKRHLYNGTTTCSYFATIHLEATKKLVDVVHYLGQRGFIGKVNMDRNATPALTETTQGSIKSTREIIDYIHSKKNSLLTPVVTPRFVPSTSIDLMKGLGQIAKEYSPPLHIQSHLSENEEEIEWVAELHPECSSYTSVYDKYGLLTKRTYMAHCIWCCSEERQLLSKRQTAIIHCPNSNFSLQSGVCNVRRLLKEGIKVGLGTDVSGGYSASMLNAIRHAIIASKLVYIGKGSNVKNEKMNASEFKNSYPPLSYEEAFHLATLGGAECLDMQDTIGNFIVGKEFDALLINPTIEGSPIDVEKDENTLDIFQRFLFNGDDRNIEKVYVQGKIVKQ